MTDDEQRQQQDSEELQAAVTLALRAARARPLTDDEAKTLAYAAGIEWKDIEQPHRLYSRKMLDDLDNDIDDLLDPPF